jgi:hypothetical protein
MRAFGVVGDEVIVQHLLHLINGLEPCAPAFNTELFAKLLAMEAFDDSVGLGLLGQDTGLLGQDTNCRIARP